MDIGGENIGSLQQLDSQNGNNLPSDNVNISDVLDVLHNDPLFGAGAVDSMAQPPAMPPATVQIVEQPAPKALRFRYECEGRSAGSIPGVRSTAENKTFPTIRINNYIGQVTIVVSCVTKDEPYRPHPHNLVGRERCERGVCTIKARITEDANEYQFKNLGIQCVKRRDVADALQQRHTLRVDPFRTGFDHKNSPGLDLNAVRLAFQVFLHDAGGSRLFQLKPVVSDVIYDKKAMCDLQINRASHCSGSVNGGTQIILLCEKVSREDAVVVFYEEDRDGNVVWEEAANTVLVHKQAAIVFETPKYCPPYYCSRTHQGQIIVHFQLKRLTDNQRSNSLPFEYIAEFQDSKKRKTVMSPLMSYDAERYSLEPPIKMEPNRTPPHIYSPPMSTYAEAQQWTPLEPMVGPSQYNEAAAAAWGAPFGAPPAPYGGHSPHMARSPAMSHGSPLGAMSPHANLQSPISPNVHASPLGANVHASPLGPNVHASPLGPTMSPGLIQHPPQQHPPAYQMQQQEQMDTAGGGASLSALLNADEAVLQHELFSLSSLVGERGDNLSDSLRQLSTNDLFRQ